VDHWPFKRPAETPAVFFCGGAVAVLLAFRPAKADLKVGTTGA